MYQIFSYPNILLLELNMSADYLIQSRVVLRFFLTLVGLQVANSSCPPQDAGFTHLSFTAWLAESITRSVYYTICLDTCIMMHNVDSTKFYYPWNNHTAFFK